MTPKDKALDIYYAIESNYLIKDQNIRAAKECVKQITSALESLRDSTWDEIENMDGKLDFWDSVYNEIDKI